jgi:hypothetical protein
MSELGFSTRAREEIAGFTRAIHAVAEKGVLDAGYRLIANTGATGSGSRTTHLRAAAPGLMPTRPR